METQNADGKCEQTCPPRQQWPIIASVQVWSNQDSDHHAWKVIRKCPHCGKTCEHIENQPVYNQFAFIYCSLNNGFG